MHALHLKTMRSCLVYQQGTYLIGETLTEQERMCQYISVIPFLMSLQWNQHFTMIVVGSSLVCMFTTENITKFIKTNLSEYDAL